MNTIVCQHGKLLTCALRRDSGHLFELAVRVFFRFALASRQEPEDVAIDTPTSVWSRLQLVGSRGALRRHAERPSGAHEQVDSSGGCFCSQSLNAELVGTDDVTCSRHEDAVLTGYARQERSCCQRAR
eukprot:6184958-Pleurochrysis_carterae.AAC.8